MKRNALAIRLHAALAIAIYAIASQAFALDPQKTMTQFKHRSWGAAQGFDRVGAIAQTQDGYIWVGAGNGLYRFDGVGFAQCKFGGVPFPRVWTMLGVKDGSLWASSGGRVVQLKDGKSVALTTKDGSELTNVRQIYEAQDGAIWFPGDRLARLDAGQLEIFGPESGLPEMQARAVSEDHLGNLWVSLIDKTPPNNTYGLFAFRPKGASRFQLCPERHTGAAKLQARDNGKIWVAETKRSVRAFTHSGTEVQFLSPEILGGSQDILFDRDGALWMTTVGDGVFRIRQPDALGSNNVDHLSARRDTYSQIHGLSSDLVLCILEDREGNIWTGTSGGVDCFGENKITSFTTREGLPFAQDLVVGRAGDGSIWAGTRGRGFMQLTRDSSAFVDRKWPELPGPGTYLQSVYSMFATPQGQLLAGTGAGVIVLHTNGGGEFLALPDGIQPREVRAMTVDTKGGLWLCDSLEGTYRILGGKADKITQIREGSLVAHGDDAGRVWFGHRPEGLGLYQSGKYKRYPTGTNGLPRNVRAIISEPGGKVWFAGEGGISLFDGGKFKLLTRENGLPGDELAVALKDDAGFYWFAGMETIFSVSPENLQKAFGSGGLLKCNQVLNSADGLPGLIRPNLELAHPLGVKGPDGRLWFAAGKGLAVVNPRMLPKNKTPPSVHIGQLVAQGKTYARPTHVLELPVGTRSCQIEYVGLSFGDPAKVCYRYKLENYNEDWVDAGQARRAPYSYLKPRKYKFQVIASNEDGVWDEEGDSIEFAILPAFYQTAWFPPLCTVPVAMAVWGLYRLRVARVTARMKQQLEGQIKERKRIAQELHDTLLQGFTGIGLKLHAIRRKLPESLGDTKEQLQKILDQSDQYLTEARRSVWELRSTSLEKSDDFAGVLSEASQRIVEGTRIRLSFSVTGEQRKLPATIEDNLLRICEEAVTNAVKHARPTEVIVRLEFDPQIVVLRIKDNGCGFDPQGPEATKSGHFGLAGLQERARAMGGSLSLNSQTREGTEIKVQVGTM